MKKQILTMIAAVAVIASVFTGCKKDTSSTPGPTVTILTSGPTSSNTVTVTPGSLVSVNINVSAASGVNLKSMSITYTQDGGNAAPLLVFSDGSGGKKGDTTFAKTTTAYNSPSNAVFLAGPKDGDVYVYTVNAVDANGNSGSGTFTITSKGTAGGPIHTYSAKLLGGQSNTAAGSFFATSNGTVYLSADAKTNSNLIDFVYFYGATNLATIAAPADADAQTVFSSISTWSVKNSTVISASTLSTTDFDAATDDSKLTGATSGTKLNNLAVGTVGAFTTAAGKKGAFKVTALSTGASGSITINVIVQQ